MKHNRHIVMVVKNEVWLILLLKNASHVILKIPIFNYPNEKQQFTVLIVKKRGMITTKHKKCINCNLTSQTESIIIIVHFVLLTHSQMTQNQLKQEVQQNLKQ